MRHRFHQLACLLLAGSIASVAPAADETLDALLAQRACTRAAEVAAAAQQAAKDERAQATALVARARVALECTRGDDPALVAWLAQARALRERLDGADSPAVAEVELARIHRLLLLRENDAALAAAQALAARAERQSWPTELKARSALHLAWTAVQKSDAALALDASTRAMTLARGAGDDATRIAAAEHRAWALVRLGREREALALLDEIVPVAAQRHGATSDDYARILRVRGQSARMVGDHGRAIADLERALAIQQRLVEPDDRLLALYWLNLGQAHKASGDLAAARADYEQALAAEERSAAHAGPLRGQLLHSLANLERDLGKLQRAVELYAQAMPLLEQAYGADSGNLATALNNRGDAYALLGDYAAARADYTRAIAIVRQLDSPDPADYLPLANLARLELWQGRYAAAEAGFREALRMMGPASAGSEGSPVYASMGLAASLWGQQRFDAALAAALSAERVRQAALRLAASHLGEGRAIDFQEYQEPSLELVIAIAAASGVPAHLERAWQIALLARDQVTTLQAQRLAAARSDATLAPAWTEWRQASAALAHAELAGSDAAALGKARTRLEQAEAALARATSLGSVQGAGQLELADLRRALPAGTALVLFAGTRFAAPKDFDRTANAASAPRAFAFVLPPGQAAVRVAALGSLAEIESNVDAFNALLADPSTALASMRARGAALREHVWQPLLAAGVGRRVFVLPTGALHRMPWGALPSADGWLVEQGVVVHELNHERELVAAAPRGPRSGLVALADPQLDGNGAVPQGCLPATLALPGARRESIELADLWREHRGARARATLLLGGDATEARLQQALADADVVHFGTHGVVPGADCAATRLATRGATRGFALVADAPLDPAAPAVTPAALLLAPAPPADDGLLTTAKIAALDFTHTRWVVLAACSSAAGATRRYEGQFGLARAFRLAGARSVITSLWAVDDAATAQWRRALYSARLERGLDTAAAMAEAQRTVLAARRARGASTHPYYWAAFQASGDWR